VLCGDIHILMKHRGMMGDSLICRFAFNTAFIPPNNNLTLYKHTLSPDDLKKDSRVSNDMLVQLIFEDYCTTCNRSWDMSLDNYCQVCRIMFMREIANWRSIQSAVRARPSDLTTQSGNKLHF
jgi:C2 domain of PTEN tumour-suppressor protein